MQITIETRAGSAILPLLEDLARLRMTVFRAWPYLYDGDMEYERRYLRNLAASPRAAVVVALDGAAAVGASTCLPLTDETDNIVAPFRDAGIEPARVFYFGESVLLPAYRGAGIGVAFFQHREAHARAVSACDFAAFCGVERPDDHPARPPGFVPLDAFWRRRGFTRTRLTCEMHWKEVGQEHETPHRLRFWMKPLGDAALPPVAA
jgi:GNAT superfamily N-acetyltransferase